MQTNEQQLIQIETDFFSLLLGDMNAHQWFFSLFMMLLGSALWILFRVQNRKNKKVPVSFRYWLNDVNNIIATLITIIMTYVLIRFYADYEQSLASQLPEGFKRTPYFTMLIVGFGQHKLSEWIGKKAK